MIKKFKTIYLTLVVITTISILYFPYHLKYRIQMPLTRDQNKVSMLARELNLYEVPGLKFERLGKDNDGGYVVPVEALEKSDILLGYGIGSDNSFEDEFSLKYKKRSFGFDCGIRNIEAQSRLFSFIPHCIGSANHILKNQTASGYTSTFSQQISFLQIMDKDVFVKMDIEGGEYEVFDDILKHSGMINGIVLKLHIMKEGMIEEAAKLLSKLNDDFLLLHIHGNNVSRFYISGENIKGKMPNIIELTFINKRLVKDFRKIKYKAYPTKIDSPNLAIREENKFEISF